MATFPCTYFTYQTRYPESGIRVQLGNSYQYDVAPEAPDQRIFTLTLPGMQYFLTSGGAIDLVASPGRNMAVLEAFYNTHKRAMAFTFVHPVLGSLQCKFNRPLEIPDGLPGGGGVLNPVTLELVEIP